MSDPGTVRRWPLRGAWRAWLWFSAALGACFLLAGVAAGVLASVVLPWPSGAGALLPGLVLVAVGAMITWQVLHATTTVLLHPDGTLVLQRLVGELRTHTGRVRSMRDSRLRSSYTPTVVQTDDGWVYLVRGRREKAEIVAAIGGPVPGPAR